MKQYHKTTIKGMYGEEIKQGDRVAVSYCHSTRANGTCFGFGTFIGGDQYGGVIIEFDEPARQDSKISGVTYEKKRYLCSLGSRPSIRETYYLDGYPCRGPHEFIASEEEYNKNKEKETVTG
jgi:hypothetical protein